MASVAALLTTGIIAAVVAQSPAGITTSNRLTAARDARVLSHTMTPKANWRGPYTWVITITDTVNKTVDSLVHQESAEVLVSDSTGVHVLTQQQADSLVTRKRGYIDTVFTPYPVCAIYRVSVFPKIRFTATGRISTVRDSLTRKVSLCRPFSAAEIAWRDSFPTSHWRITTCGPWAYRIDPDSLLDWRLVRARTAAETALAQTDIANLRRGADSITPAPRTWVKTDTMSMLLGYEYPLGLLMKNRYTGKVHSEPYTDDTIVTTPRRRIDCSAEVRAFETWTGDSLP
jgi:hypothetical protein